MKIKIKYFNIIIVFFILANISLQAQESEILNEKHTTAAVLKPQAARSEIKFNSARAKMVSALFAQHFDGIVGSSRNFDLVNSQNVIDVIAHNGYNDDASLIRFAESSDISILVAGSIDDSGSKCVIHLYALCYDAPHFGDRIGSYRALIDFGNNNGSASSIIEEHTARFLAGLFSKYRHPAAVERLIQGELADGSYDLYAKRNDREPSGKVLIEKGLVRSASEGFVHKDYRSESVFLTEFYYGRKKEMVLPPNSSEQALYTAVATPLISLVAPIASPASYYSVSDFGGLGLWALNNSPWLYVAADGFFRSPENLQDQGRHATRYNNAANGFMWYYFMAAGSSLYADSISNYSMNRASTFDSMLPWTGNEDTAFALSVLGSGGGFFYKGERAWGYLYFHTDALLLFSSLYCLLPEAGRSDDENSRYRTQGYFLAAGAVAVRVVQYIHCSNTPFAIKNGEQIEGSYALSPYAGWDGSLVAGISATVRL